MGGVFFGVALVVVVETKCSEEFDLVKLQTQMKEISPKMLGCVCVTEWKAESGRCWLLCYRVLVGLEIFQTPAG